MQPLKIEQINSDEQLASPDFLARISDVAIEFTRDGRSIKSVNPRLTEALGWSETELVEVVPLANLLTDESRNTFDKFLTRLTTEPAIADPHALAELLVLEFQNQAGLCTTINFHTVFVSPARLLALGNANDDDATIQERLRQTEARFRSIVDSLSIRLVLKDRAGGESTQTRAI